MLKVTKIGKKQLCYLKNFSVFRVVPSGFAGDLTPDPSLYLIIFGPWSSNLGCTTSQFLSSTALVGTCWHLFARQKDVQSGISLLSERHQTREDHTEEFRSFKTEEFFECLRFASVWLPRVLHFLPSSWLHLKRMVKKFKKRAAETLCVGTPHVPKWDVATWCVCCLPTSCIS